MTDSLIKPPVLEIYISDTSYTMATVLPPPSKRQRTDAADKARAQQDIEEIPSDAGSLRIQFYDETTGLAIGSGPVLVPVADASPKNLELLLNALLNHVGTMINRNAGLWLIAGRTPQNISHTDSLFLCQIRRRLSQLQPPSQPMFGRH